MNAESFADYLAQPAKLYQLPYQEIKNLVAEYPFSANLRYLLLLKARIEQDPKFERYLHQYAAHGPDRYFLYQLLQEKLPELLDLEIEQEEKLELLDLSAFREKEAILLDSQEEVLPPQIALEQTPPTPPTSPAATSTQDDLETDEFPTPSPIPREKTTESEAATATVSTADTPASSVSEPLEEASSSAETNATQVAAPLPKTAFDFWQHEPSRATGRRRFARLRGQNLRERATGNAAQVRKVAKESVAQQADLASETLAILLERQGQYDRAIEMYERLSLLNPEKSRYFAAAIEKLKQKA